MVRKERVGNEPSTSRSAYGARAVLAALGAVLMGAGAVLAAVTADGDGRICTLAVACAALCLVALVDLGVVLWRRYEERRPLI
ncbi:hypothetical protein EV189_4030 [Motilibacter rhizosphaerae]|uniref:Uncharacterized protein n=1 Tax=Motilibacter rhizosphaerae TaxID=598652 RepID=A0A4Q7N7D7_9ACTN|nr:DUF6343 family protein [Motilibacter rhizosphaerae]RZS77522.1 hypothetical protein EV189_4030 [Motilibacter rhizosphaerae]